MLFYTISKVVLQLWSFFKRWKYFFTQPSEPKNNFRSCEKWPTQTFDPVKNGLKRFGMVYYSGSVILGDFEIPTYLYLADPWSLDPGTHTPKNLASIGLYRNDFSKPKWRDLYSYISAISVTW